MKSGRTEAIAIPGTEDFDFFFLNYSAFINGGWKVGRAVKTF